MTTPGRRKGKRDRLRREEALLEALSQALSEEEIQRVLAGALLELDPAGRKRLAERLDEDTAAALRQVLEPGRKKPRPGVNKVLQEWDRAWSDWNDCVFESGTEDGRYVLQDAHWEAPYLDSSALAADLEPIAARMRELLPRVVDEDLAPEFSFRAALEETAQEIGSGLPEWINDPEGCYFEPQVTECLLEWEWRVGRREGRHPFEIVDRICRLEASLEDASLDGEAIAGFVLDLGDRNQQAILAGITDHRHDGPWPRVLRDVYSGWFVLHQELARRWDAEQFLAVCLANIEQNWKLALPPVKDLLRRKAFGEAQSLIEKAVASLLHLGPGEAWDPRQGLLIQHPMQRYRVEDRPARGRLLEAWRKVALGLGQEDVAGALQLQAELLARWEDWDTALEAFRQAEGPAGTAACELLFADWRRRVSEVTVGTAEGWVPGLADAARADDAAVFHRAVRSWLKQIEEAGDLEPSLRPLGELSVILDPGSKLKRASPALHALLSRGPEKKGKLAGSVRRWVRRLRGRDLLPEVLAFWKRNAALLVPDPAHAGGSDYTRCAEWLAVVLDLDPPTYTRILQDWSVRHRRRRNLWQALREKRLPLEDQG